MPEQEEPIATTPTLQTQYVMLDTAIFDEKCYSFGNRALQQFRVLAERRLIKPLITPIIEQESKRHISAYVGEIKSLVKKLRKDRVSKVLRNIIPAALDYNFEEVEDGILTQFEEFLRDCNFEEISLDKANTERVFEHYFELQPPFEQNKDKKSEFPDAFSVDATDNWCVEHKVEVYVISRDNGLKRACDLYENLIPLDSLEDYLDLFSAQEKDLYEFAKATIAEQKQYILDRIKHLIEDEELELEDEGGFEYYTEITKQTVTYIAIKEIKVLSAETQKAVVEVEVDVKLEVDLEFVDPDRYYYDGETKEAVYMERKQYTYTGDEIISITLELYFPEGESDPSVTEIEQIEIEQRPKVYFDSYSDGETIYDDDAI